MWTALETESSFRILRILPGPYDDSIICELYQASLDDDSCIYHALSCTWGSLDTPCEVVCNGSAVAITENLHFALRNIRAPDAEVLLWVDALCINQSRDPDGLREREQQLQLMWRIFSQAQKVTAYLGDEFDGFEKANCFLQVSGKISFDDIPDRPLQSFKELGNNYKLPGPSDRLWFDFFRLCDSTYFRRV
jgi:hypothetical protein